jgi:arginase family enzyme
MSAQVCVQGLRVMGVPLDIGGNPGAGLGATRLLRVFHRRFERLRTGDCPERWRGWADRADIRDVAYTLDTNFETWRARVDDEVQDALASDLFPSFVGGNHLAVGTAMVSLLEAIPDAVVVSLDAHFDLDPVGGATGAMDHSNFWSRLLDRPGSRVRWIGSRGDPPATEPGVLHVSAARLRERGIERAVEDLGVRDRPVLLDIDLDVLDPSTFPALVSRAAGGPDWLEVSGLIRHLARTARIQAIGISEYNPLLDDRFDTCLGSAADLLLHALDAVLPKSPV